MSIGSMCAGLSVTVERPTPSVDVHGAPVLTYASNLTSQPMKIDESSGAETDRYGARSERIFGRAYCPDSPDILPKDRIVYGSRYLDVQAVRIKRRPNGVVSHLEIDWEETEN